MKAHLLFPDGDVDLKGQSPQGAEDTVRDLDLDTLFQAMGRGDQYLSRIAATVVLSSLKRPCAIEYRQHVLQDCLGHPDLVRSLYALAVAGVEAERKLFLWYHRSPDSILHRSVQLLELYTGLLKRLRATVEENGAAVRSEGFVGLFQMIVQQLDDAFFADVERDLRALRFRGGVLISARLGRGNKGTDFVLRRPLQRARGLIQRVVGPKSTAFSFEIDDRDQSGSEALVELRGRGINTVANALAQSADHVFQFFTMLRAELAFYVGCLNLHEELSATGGRICIPAALPVSEARLAAEGLYNPCLALHGGGRVVGNDLAADGKEITFITGANQGGKSTFLRSVGLGYLMMQCGMFVAADRFTASVSTSVMTHFQRDEDTAMRAGRLEEELARMSSLIPSLEPGGVVLCNESFASTNEREGAEVARQIIRALVDAKIRVLFVTHMYDLAHGFFTLHTPTALFLRAEREPNGERSFRLVEGEPQATSFGEDVYRAVFMERLHDG